MTCGRGSSTICSRLLIGENAGACCPRDEFHSTPRPPIQPATMTALVRDSPIASKIGQGELTRMSELMTSQARPAATCSWLRVSCIESSRSCRLVACMHSTSFVLGKGVGCLRFIFCELVSNSDGLWARVWCLLSASFVVNSRHRTAGFTAGHWPYASSIVGTRKPQIRSQRALWRFRRRSPGQEEKNSFHE